MNTGTSAPFSKLGGKKFDISAKLSAGILDSKDGLNEVDIIKLGESIRQPFRNHELLNAVMLREEAPVHRVVISNDLEKLYYLRSDRVVIRKLGDLHSPLATIEEENTAFESIDVSRDNRFVAVAVSKDGGNQLRLHNSLNLNVTKTITDFDNAGTIRYLSFSPDNKRIAVAHSDSNVYVFGVDDESKIVLGTHGGAVTCVKFLSDSVRLLAGDSQGQVSLWDVNSQSQDFTVGDEGQDVTSFAVTNRDEEFVTSNMSGNTTYYRMNGQQLHTFSEGGSHYCCAVTSDDRFVLVGTNNSRIIIWNLESKSRITALIEHGRGLRDICLTSDDRYYVSAGGDYTIFLMGLTEKKLRGRMKGHQNQIYAMDLSPDGQYLATGGMDIALRIWDTRQMKQVNTSQFHRDTINGLSFSANGEMLVTGSMDSDVIVYKTSDWSVLKHIRGQGWKTVYNAIFNTKCTWVLFGADAIVRIYDLETEQEVAALEGHTKQVRCVCITKDDRIACSGGHDRCIRIWDLQQMKSIGKLDGHNNFVLTIALTPDDSTIVSSGSDCTVRIWDLEDQRVMSILKGHTGYVKSLRVTADSKYIVSSSLDKTIRVWDIARRKQVGQMNERNVENAACAVSRDLRFIYAGGNKGEFQVVVWNFLSADERTAFRKSPIKSNIDYYIERNKHIKWTGSKYAYKFQVPGLPEALFRYTMAGEGDIGVKLDTLRDNFFPIMPEFYTLLHVCAAAPFPGLLSYLLENDELYSVDAFGKTPLTYAIQASNSDAIKIIIEHFRTCQERFEVTFFDVQQILEMENKDGPEIYRMAFFDFGLETPSKPKGVLPEPIVVMTAPASVLKNSDYKRYGYDFFGGEESDHREIVSLNSKFRYNSALGSQESIDFLKLLVDTSLDEIWDTNVKYVIEEKWQRVRAKIIAHSVAHLLYLVLISLYVTTSFGSVAFAAVCFVLSALNYLYEILQMYAERGAYFTDFWNYLDFLGTFLFMLHCILVWAGVLGSNGDALIGIAVLLLWSRAIGDLRAFQTTRYLVRLIMEVFMDIPSFMIILVISGYMFAVIFYSISPRAGDHSNWLFPELTTMYRMIYGDFNEVDNYGPVAWIFFILATVLVPLVMMNLLIAIISDTFERVYSSKTASDYKEKTALILEVENLMFWNRRSNEKTFLHIIKYRGEDDQQTGEWDGRAAALKKDIGKMIKTHENKIIKAIKNK